MMTITMMSLLLMMTTAVMIMTTALITIMMIRLMLFAHVVDVRDDTDRLDGICADVDRVDSTRIVKMRFIMWRCR